MSATIWLQSASSGGRHGGHHSALHVHSHMGLVAVSGYPSEPPRLRLGDVLSPCSLGGIRSARACPALGGSCPSLLFTLATVYTESAARMGPHSIPAAWLPEDLVKDAGTAPQCALSLLLAFRFIGLLAASIRDRRDRVTERGTGAVVGVESLIPTSRNNRPSNVLWQNHSTERSLGLYR